MENAEEILQCLDEFSKLKPKDIPRELEDYLCFVAKTGDPVYQWPLIKCLFREKLLNVITEFYETCPTVEIPPCPNVDVFNYDVMKNFILEKLDTFAAAPFTVQRICELLTSPRKEYNRIDKYMRALEKNILVVSTREPGNRKSTENGESVVNGLESEHGTQDMVNSDVNVEVEMDETATWQKTDSVPYAVSESNIILEPQPTHPTDSIQDTYVSESKVNDNATCSSSGESVITSRPISYIGYTPNITDLIIEPSNVSNNAEPGPTPMTVERDTTNITVFTMSNEYPVPAEQPQTETVKEVVEPVYPTVEPSVVQIEPPTNSEPKIEPEPLVHEPDPPTVTIVEAVEPSVEIQPEVQSEPEPSGQPEPESSTVAQVQPESSIVFVNTETEQPVESASEEQTNETTISSTEQLPANSTDEIQEAPHQTGEAEVAETNADSQSSNECTSVSDAAEIPASTSEDEVTESNIESEYVVSQTEESVEPSVESSAVPAEEPPQEPAEEKMQVDEVTTEATEVSVAETSDNN